MKQLYIIIYIFIAGILLILPTNAYSYSITNVEDYYTLNDLTPWGTLVSNNVTYWLGTQAGWTKNFQINNNSVSKFHFDSIGSPTVNLDQSEFHYHFGHGSYTGYPARGLIDLYSSPAGVVSAGDVNKRWDNVNKWVFIDACKVLKDRGWGGALKYSHGLLGFTTIKWTSTDLPNRFFQKTITYDYTIQAAFIDATVATYDNTVNATMGADTTGQLNNDHLPGQGYVEPNENPDDSYSYWLEWRC